MLELLYRKHRTAMLGRAMSILSDHALAEDAVQEAFIRIARHMGRFEKINSDECRYLCLTIVKNAALNMKRDRKVTEELPETLPAFTSDSAFGLDITTAIDALEENHRQVVLLRLLYGFNTIETARLLGIKPGTVLSRLSRARVFLRKVLR